MGGTLSCNTTTKYVVTAPRICNQAIFFNYFLRDCTTIFGNTVCWFSLQWKLDNVLFRCFAPKYFFSQRLNFTFYLRHNIPKPLLKDVKLLKIKPNLKMIFEKCYLNVKVVMCGTVRVRIEGLIQFCSKTQQRLQILNRIFLGQKTARFGVWAYIHC